MSHHRTMRHATATALTAVVLLLQSSCGLRTSYLPRRGRQLYASSLPSPSPAASDSERVMCALRPPPDCSFPLSPPHLSSPSCLSSQLLRDEGITKGSVVRFAHDCTIGVAETRAVLAFLRRVVGSPDDVPKIVASCPRILARNVSDLQPTYDFLVLLYGTETAER